MLLSIIKAHRENSDIFFVFEISLIFFLQSSPHDNCENNFLIQRPTFIFIIKLRHPSMNIKHIKSFFFH